MTHIGDQARRPLHKDLFLSYCRTVPARASWANLNGSTFIQATFFLNCWVCAASRSQPSEPFTHAAKFFGDVLSTTGSEQEKLQHVGRIATCHPHNQKPVMKVILYG